MTEKKKIGRPKKYDIDPEQVEKLASYGLSNTIIAEFFDVGEHVIRKSYAENLVKGRAIGKIRLSQMQWKSAEKGNVTMQIWLGKQYLGQSDKQEVQHVRPIDEIEFDGI